jgi:hypothetical protein
VKHGELLAAISDLDPVEVKGDFERHCGLRWEDLMPSAAGGRWGARRAFEVLYLGRPRESVVVEAYRHLVDDELDLPGELAAAVIERRVLTCEVKVNNILDLRSQKARTRVDVADSDLFSAGGIQTLPSDRRRSPPARPLWRDCSLSQSSRRNACPLQHKHPSRAVANGEDSRYLARSSP